jgi:hypothetical protein
MKEWQYRQEYFHRTATIDDTDIENMLIANQFDDQQAIEYIVKYFTDEQPEVVQPYKSMCVAIIYAQLLSKHFDESFYEALDHPFLLFGNDQFFIPYLDRKKVYDAAIEKIPLEVREQLENLPFSQIKSTVEYFRREFLIE